MCSLHVVALVGVVRQRVVDQAAEEGDVRAGADRNVAGRKPPRFG